MEVFGPASNKVPLTGFGAKWRVRKEASLGSEKENLALAVRKNWPHLNPIVTTLKPV